MIKKCKFCNKEFSPDSKHTYQIYCSRFCAHKIQVIKNPKKFKDNARKYYLNNKAKIKKHSKEWRIKNRAKYLKINKGDYQKNKVKIKKVVREWYDNNKAEENVRRRKLGLPEVGQGYKREMELLMIIRKIFPENIIKVHTRRVLSKWSHTGLEIDIYLPELKIGFEYMGKQHYNEESFKALTKMNRATEDFKYQKYRDRCKKRLCRMKEITLIIIKYDEPLTTDLILNKLKIYGVLKNRIR